MRSLGLLALLMCCLYSVSAAPVFIQDNSTPWSLDSNVTYNDVATLRTGAISDDGTTSVTLTFKNVSTVEFYVRASSEGGCDFLTVSFDGSTEYYSGETEWWGCWNFGWEGEHTVTLTYSKDGSVSSGDDCCWIWFEGVDSIDLGGDSEKDWDMSKDNPWVCDPWTTEENSEWKRIPYMMAPPYGHDLYDGQECWMSYAVEGIESFSFKYRVSSEENSDFLVVTVDGTEIVSFSGETGCQSYEIQLPDTGRHIIRWSYRKDFNWGSGGEDRAWVWFDGIEKIMLDGYYMNMVYPWEVDYSEGCWEGNALMSGELPEGAATSFSKTITGSEEFTFRWKTSSEEGSDYLRYYVNGELKGELSGMTDWNYETISCNAGDEVTWEYSKDENGVTDGQDCGWVDFPGIGHLNDIIGIFPDEDTLTVTKIIAVDMEAGRDVLRNFLDGDEGVSFASGDPLVWVYDENEGAMRSAAVSKGGESWMSAAVIGKGTFSFRWKCSGETLSCYVDGQLKETLYGWNDWTQVDVALENDARHEIKWVFTRGEDSSDVTACGWVDGIVWNAIGGWDDPDEPNVPHTLSTFIAVDLCPSPRVLDTTNFCERITYDPAWRNAASVVLTVDASEAVKATESGTFEWKSEKEGLFRMKLEFLDSVGAAIGEPLTASFKIVLDPLPALGENATAEDVASILGGVADGKLKVNVVEAAEYANFRAWLQAKGINHNDVTKSLFAWLSFALDTAGLIVAEPKEGDVTIDTFEKSATDGAFDFTVKIDGIAVGQNALEANIRKAFEVEGAEDLGNGTFSDSAVGINAASPENGKVKFTVAPKGENPPQFFFKVKLK